MKSNPVFLLETLLFEGLALAFGIWQLWTVWPRKTPKTDPSAPASDEGARHAEGEHGANHG
jgi:hypothetical protein